MTVQVQSGAQLVDGAQANLDFDPAYLQVIQLAGNSQAFPLGLQNQFDNISGTIDYAAGAIQDLPSGTFDVVLVQFEAITETASTALTFHFGVPRDTDVTYGGYSILTDYGNGVVSIYPEVECLLHLPLVMRGY